MVSRNGYIHVTISLVRMAYQLKAGKHLLIHTLRIVLEILFYVFPKDRNL